MVELSTLQADWEDTHQPAIKWSPGKCITEFLFVNRSELCHQKVQAHGNKWLSKNHSDFSNVHQISQSHTEAQGKIHPRVPDPHPHDSLPDSVNSQSRSLHLPLGFCCHKCNMWFTNRSLLNAHYLNHHQIGQGGLHYDPFNNQNAPWIKLGGIDDQLRHIYLSNRPLMLERYWEGSIEFLYNFQVNKQIQRIYVTNHFKFVFEYMSYHETT